MKNFTRILIAASSVLMLSSNAYSQDVFRTANVGIGTTAPQQKLDVAGSIKFSNALMPNGVPGSTGNILLSEGAGNPPIWLSNGTTGTILVANSSGVPTWSSANSALLTTSNIVNGGANSAIVVTNGTGQVVGSGNVTLDVQGTAGGILYGQGIGSSAIFTSAGTTGQVLTSGGTGAPTWTTPSLTAGWLLLGNSSTTAANFIGTTVNEPLIFKVNNVFSGAIDYTNQSVVLGYGAGSVGGGSAENATSIGGSTIIGYEAAYNNTSNLNGTIIGAYALYSAVTPASGNVDVAIGYASQYYVNNNGAYQNTSVGAYSLYSNTGGEYETALGYQSMFGTGTNTGSFGNYNTAVGYSSLYNSTGVGGGSNTAVGSYSLYSSTGGKNTAVGDSALASNTSGEYNSALGYQANVSSGTLTNATAIGYASSALASNSITLGNTAVTSLYLPGYTSVGSILYTAANTGQVASLIPGAAGTILVSQGTNSAPSWASVAGINSVTGTQPIYVNSSTPSSPNVYIEGLSNNSDAGGVLYSLGSGTSALFTPTPTAANLVLTSAAGGGAPTWKTAASATSWNLLGNAGTVAGTDYLGTTDANALEFEVNGHNAGSIDPLGTGSYNAANVYLGSYGVLGGHTYGSAGNNDAGEQNVGIGLSALGSIAGLQYVGSITNLGTNNTDVADEVAVGAFALANDQFGEDNIALGAYSQSNENWATSANGFNTSVGTYSLYSNSTGQNNTALGYYSMYGSGTSTALGNNNTAMGYQSLYAAPAGVASNTAIGSNSLYNVAASRNTAVGDSALYSTTGSNNTAIGYQASVASGSLSNATAIGASAYATQSNSLILGSINGVNGATSNTSVGIGTNTPNQALEVAPTTSTIRVDGLANLDTYNTQITANPGNIVYTNNATGDLYSLPNGTTGTVLTLNANSVPSWASPNAALTTYSITGNTGTAVVISGGNLNSVVGSGNVTLDVQSTTPEQGGIFYGTGTGTAATFNTTGSSGQVLLSAGTGAPTWGSFSAGLTTNNILNGGANSSVVVTNGTGQVVGGTNVNVDVQGTAGGILYGQGTGSSAIFTSTGASGQVLEANTAGVPTWTTLTAAPNAWLLTGNAISATYGTNYLGTMNSGEPVEFKVNNAYAGIIDATASNIYLGRGTGGDSTVLNTAAGTNVAIGWEAFATLASTTAASNVAAIGADALHNDQASNNNAVGAYALYKNTSGTPNDAYGYGAAFSNSTGTNNLSLGFEANYYNQTGNYNVAAGDSAMWGGFEGTGALYTTANYNTAVGVSALSAITTNADYNTALGYEAAIHNTTGSGNVALGYQAAYTNTTGIDNTVIGYAASVSAANLTNATAIGYQATALASNSITLGNTAVTSLYLPGYTSTGALLYTSAANGLVAGLAPGAIGTILESSGTTSIPTWVSIAGINSVSGTPPIYVNSSTPTAPNVYIQGLANNSDAGGVLYSLGSSTSALFTPTPTASGLLLTSNGAGAPTWTSGSATNAWNLNGNTISGTYGTQYLGTTGAGEPLELKVNNTYAGLIDAGASDIYLGKGAGGDSVTYVASGSQNVGIGWEALTFKNSSTVAVAAIGADALHNDQAPYNNAVGAYALYKTTTGDPNDAFGYGAGFYNTTGTYNLALGFEAGYYNQTGNDNVAVGDSAMWGGFGGIGALYTASTANTAVGVSALSAIASTSSSIGANNTALGYEAAQRTTTGTGNTTLGYQAGYASTVNAADVLTTGNYNTLMGYQASVSSGSLSNATAIGYQAIAPASNSITLGNSAVTALYLPGYSAVGNILYTATTTGQVAALTPGIAGTILESTGTASAPTWVSIAGVNSVTGTPPIYINGTATVPNVNIQGNSSGTDMGGVLYSTGSGNSAVFTSTGTTGYVLTSTGAGAPTWAAPTAASTAWSLVGNAIASTASFLGTTNALPLIFQVDGANAGRIDIPQTAGGNGNVYFGSYGVLGTTTYGSPGGPSGDGGDDNIGIGLSALGGANPAGSSIGVQNIAIGAFAYPAAIGGEYNVAIGPYSQLNAAFTNTTTGSDVAVGPYAMYSNSTGSDNTAMGYQSMYGSGTATVYGPFNTAIGYYSLYNASSGGSNTAVGTYSLFNSTAGRNTAVGDSALASLTTGEYNTGIGYQANVSAGNLSNATVVGYQASALASNSVTLGNSAVNALYLPGYTSSGALLYTSAASGLVSGIVPGATGTVLESQGTSAPTWVSVAGVNSLTANAPIYANNSIPSAPVLYIQGLANNSDAGGVLYSVGSGSSALFTPTPSATGLLLTSNGASAPTWTPPSAVTAGWSLTGNSITAGQFLGTTDAQPIVFEVNNSLAGRIDLNNGVSGGLGNVYFGSYGVLGTTTYGSAGGPTGDGGNDNVGIGLSALGGAGSSAINGQNTAIGAFALPATTGGVYNVAIGAFSQFNAAFTATSVGYNVAVGPYSLYSNSTGQDNTALGYQSMYGSGTATVYGAFNTAIGYYSLYNASSGGSNTAVGTYSLYNSTAGRNTAVGDSALALLTTGEYNTGVGYQANVSSGTISNATVIGYQASAPASNSVTLGNTAVNALYLPGYSAVNDLLYTSATTGLVAGLAPGAAGTVLESQGTNNVPVWASVAGVNSVTGTAPIYVNNSNPATPNVYIEGLPANTDAGGILYSLGSANSALFTPTPSASNLVLLSNGAAAPTWGSPSVTTAWSLVGNTISATYGTNYVGTTGVYEPLVFKTNNTYVGMLDQANVNGESSVYFGQGTGGDSVSYIQTAGSNVALGWEAFLSPSLTTTQVIAIGAGSLRADVASNNNGIGFDALHSTTTGTPNDAFGYEAGFSNTIGNYNVSVGYEANYYNRNGNDNVAVGDSAMWGGFGGTGAIYTLATGNTAVGVSALSSIASNSVVNGAYNTALGYQAGLHTTTGYNNVALGYQAGDAYSINTADILNTGFDNTLVGYQASVSSGSLSNATAIGYQAIAPASNSITLGNASVTALYLPGYSTVGNLLYTSATTGLVSGLTPGGSGTVLISNGPGVAPTWATTTGVNLVSGTAPISVNNSTATNPIVSIVGTAANSGGVLYSTGSTSAVFTATPTASGLVLTSTAAGGAPSWTVLPVGPTAWNITGNSGTTPGTNFVGTTDANRLAFKVNGVVAGSIDGSTTAGSAGEVNTYLGYGVGVNGSSTGNAGASGDWGNSNTAMGTEALGNIPTNTSSVADVEAIGAYAMYDASYGSANEAIGAYSQFYANAPNNTSIGAFSLYSNTGNGSTGTTGINETALGYLSMFGTGGPEVMGNDNTAIGYYSLYNSTTGGSNTAVGGNTLFNTVGGRNTAVGDSALYSNTTGEFNTAVGYQALANTSGSNGNTGGNYNTALGYYANVASGGLTNATAIGANAYATQNNTVVLGSIAGVNNATTTAIVCVGTSVPAADAALAIKTGHLESQAAISGTIALASAATGVTVTALSGSTDVGGTVTFTEPSSGWVTGAQATLTFANTYATPPTVIITPITAATSAIMGTYQPYVTSTATGFSVNFGTAANAATACSFNYFVIETQ